VTFVVALLSPSDSTFQLLSAGHGPILHYQAAAGEFQDYAAQGIPLGLMASIAYGPPHEVRLERGDMLVLTTDGFFEWENPGGEEFGVERLKQVVQENRDRSPEELIQELHSAVTRFSEGTKQADDLTAVILKKTGD